MHVSRSFTLSVLALALGWMAHSAAQAVPLTQPVSSNFADTALGGTTAAARPELAGTVLEDVLTAFSFSGVVGTVQNRVVREAGTGTLDFYWKVNVAPGSDAAGVSALRLTDFGYANLSDADWRSDDGTIASPVTARLFNVAPYPTGSLNFLFGNPVLAGEASHLFFLHTTATSYAQTGRYDLLTGGDQALSGPYATFAPAVPEPASYGMAAAGVALVGVMWRRRRPA